VARFTQRDRQAILTWIAAKLSEHERSGDGSLPDRCRQAQDFVPMRPDVLDVDAATDEAGKRRVLLGVTGAVKAFVCEVANARRETQTQQVHQRRHVAGKAGCIRIMFLNAQVGFVIQQAVQDVGGVTYRRVNDLGWFAAPVRRVGGRDGGSPWRKTASGSTTPATQPGARAGFPVVARPAARQQARCATAMNS
jgi:hypothetical protein